MTGSQQFPLSKKIAAWSVHLYTMSGGAIGLVALSTAANDKIREAFLLLLLALLVDGTDGMMARRVNVKVVLPQFDGGMIDNVIDVLNFIWIPIFIMVEQDLLPHPIWLVFPVIAAMYAYGQVNMKTEDAFFLGFPSYWNFIALYLFWLQPNTIMTAFVILIPTVLTFIPTRYLYPSKNDLLWKTSWGLGAIWITLIVYLLLQETPNQTLVFISLFYPAYYMIASFFTDWQLRRNPTT